MSQEYIQLMSYAQGKSLLKGLCAYNFIIPVLYSPNQKQVITDGTVILSTKISTCDLESQPRFRQPAG